MQRWLLPVWLVLGVMTKDYEGELSEKGRGGGKTVIGPCIILCALWETNIWKAATQTDWHTLPAQISTASQHLNSGLSQLLDHYTPFEWSWFSLNGLHTFVKQGSERHGCKRRKGRTLFHIHLPKPFHCTNSSQTQSCFCPRSLGLTESC